MGFGSLEAAAPPIALISCHRCLGERDMMLMGEGVVGDFSDLSNCFQSVSKTVFFPKYHFYEVFSINC